MTNDIEMTAYRVMAETGLSARELAEMDMDAYARATGRPTPVQAALGALDTQERLEPTAAPQSAPQAQPQGLDSDSPEYFHAWRAQRTRGGEGVGIFDSVSSQSEEYRAAARQQAGRTGWSTSNVMEPPRLEGRYLNHDERLDHRSAAARLSNAANLWQGR